MMRKYLAVLLCVLIAVTFIPVTAFAAGEGTPDEPAALDNAAIAENFAQTLVGEERNDPSDEQEYLNLIADAIEHAGDPADFASWAGSELFRRALGLDDGDKTAEIMKSLDALMANVEALSAQVEQLNDNVIKSDIARELNEFFTLDWDNHLKLYYNTLRGIDQDGSLTEQQRYDKRMQALIFDFTDNKSTEPSGVLCPLDDRTNILGHYLTDGLAVVYQPDKANLMDMYQYFCRLNYHWEHQAYDDWISFQNAAFGMYLNAAFIDRLSLDARIQALEKAGKPHDTLDNQLEDLKATIKKVKEIYQKRKITKRPDNVRYYWHPGNEKLIYAEAHQHKVPWEENHQKYGITSLNYLEGIEWHVYHGMKDQYIIDGPKYSFWRPFTSYTRSAGDGGGYVKCPTAEWYEQVYKDYNMSKNLYEIFFSKDEGNLKAPSGSKDSWSFVVDPDQNNPMSYYDGGMWHEDQVVTPVVDSKAELSKAARNEKGKDIYWYHYGSSEACPAIVKAGYNYIGIGLVDEFLVAEDDVHGEGTVTKTPAQMVALNAVATKKGTTLTWTKAAKASSYEVYQKKEGAASFKKIKTISDPEKNSLKIAKKKLKKKAGYVYYVKVLGQDLNGEPVEMDSWEALVFPADGKYTNVKKLSLTADVGASFTMASGETKGLDAKVTKVKKSKKLPKTYAPIRYASSDESIATVDENGQVTAKAGGSCFIYAFGTNGVFQSVGVTVK